MPEYSIICGGAEYGKPIIKGVNVWGHGVQTLGFESDVAYVLVDWALTSAGIIEDLTE